MTTARPFLRWPGGKRWLASEIAQIYLERERRRYVEPFLGGGAVFLSIGARPAILGDINGELINSYVQVRDNHEEVLRRLKAIPVNKATYDDVRCNLNDDQTDRAVRFLYLNRTAFSGIYRVNRRNEFNVPYGGGQRGPELLWKKGILQRAAEILQGAQFVKGDFASLLGASRRRDFVYCDPTYTVKHNNNGFLRYNERIFGWHDQERLARSAERARLRGVTVVVSNADHGAIEGLYPNFHVRRVTRMSRLAPSSSDRGHVTELLLVGRPDDLD